MEKIQSQVKEFMLAAGQRVEKNPRVPNEETRALRVRLLLEEVFELAEASSCDIKLGNVSLNGDSLVVEALSTDEEEIDLALVADCVADINYVSYGAALAYGIDMEKIEDTVHAANMRKFGEGSYRREDGKWMKPPDWVGPEEDIEDIIQNQL